VQRIKRQLKTNAIKNNKGLHATYSDSDIYTGKREIKKRENIISLIASVVDLFFLKLLFYIQILEFLRGRVILRIGKCVARSIYKT